MSVEKAKDFKGSMAKLFRYMGRYKFRFILMFIFAVAGTVFSIVGPKILGKATTELFNGLVAKVNGTGEIDFGKIGMILLWTLGLYNDLICTKDGTDPLGNDHSSCIFGIFLQCLS